MAVELADAYVSITASAKGIGKSISDELGGVDSFGRDAGDRTSKGFMGSFGSGIAGLAVAVGGAFAAIGIGTFLKGTIDAASDLNETVSKVGVIFGDSAGIVEKFASTAASSLGQSKQQALDAASTFATFGKSAGLSGDALAGFSTGLVGTSADLASFFNTSPEQAIEAIGSALRGEAEPIRQYGILLDDATLRNRALKLGLISTTKEALTPQNKVLAAQAEILAQTTDAQGDFARTSDGLANKQRILSAQFADVKAKIGQALLPVMSALVGFISDKVLPAFTGLGDKVGPIITEIVGAFKAFFAAFKAGDGDVTSSGIPGFFERLANVVGPIIGALVGGFKAFFAAFKAGDGDVTSSGFAGTMEKIANALRDVWDWLKSVDWRGVFNDIVDAVSPLVSSIKDGLLAAFDLLATVWTTTFQLIKDNRETLETVAGVVKNVLATAFDVASKAVDAVSGVFKFLADHMELVKAIVIPLAAAFLAYKIVMTGIAAVTWLVNTATAAWTAVQTAFNIVMALNPIGIVVAAIAALVAGVIYAYFHFDSFRAIVDTVWQVLQTAFGWIRDNWPLLLAVLLGPFGVAILVVVKNFDTIKAAVMGVWDWISEHWPLLLAIITGPIGLAVLAIIKNWDSIKDTFTSVKDWIWGKINDIVGFFTAIPGRIWASITWIGDSIRNGIDAARDFVWRTLDAIVGYFLGLPGRLAGAFSGMFDGIYNAFRSAINYVIDGWNSLRFGIPEFDTHIPGLGKVGGGSVGTVRIPRLAAGGAFSAATMAIIGENSSRSNPEIAAPQSAIRDAVADALQGFRGGVTVNATTMADAYDIAREVAWQQKTAGV